MVKVLDATALVAYLKKESGYEKVKEAFVNASGSNKFLLMSTVNWGEVFYLLAKDQGIEQAENIQKVIETFPIEFVAPDLLITKQAALFKALKKLPYADCFAAALTKIHKGELYTGDNDFRAVEGEIKVIWIK